MIRRAAIAVAVLALLPLAGCGGSGDSGSDELASLAPADVPAFMEFVVRPEGAQRDAIESLSSRVGGIDDLGGAIVQQLDAQFAESGANVTYEDDIAPWLGERAGFFSQSLHSEAFAVMVETTDPDVAQGFLEKVTESFEGTKEATYNGVRYFEAAGEDATFASGVVDGFLVSGTLDSFKAAVDAVDGSSLADSSIFEDGTSTLPEDNLALGYADGAQAAEEITGTPINPIEATVLKTALQTLADGPVTFAVSATPDTASVDVSLPAGVVAQLDGGDLVGQSPSDAWLSVGLQNVGGVLGNALGAAEALQVPSIEDRIKRLTGVDPKDALSWMHNGHAFVGGTSEKTIAIGGVVGSDDTQASSKAIDAFRQRFQQDADAKLGPPPHGADEGFSASAPESPQAIQVGQLGDQVVAALGPGQPGEAALHPKQPLSDDSTFQSGVDALGSDSSPLAFVSLAPFFVVAEKGGSGSDPDFISAKPYLQKLDYLMVGTSGDGDRSTARFVVGVK
ncbi:MAG TPA: DUF3352 domain-containing protein [Candidatus Limnocylindrales bacterium]|nr:DUF3352 domain-containing protein [Candidatus Limnocylindrales bacterium]